MQAIRTGFIDRWSSARLAVFMDITALKRNGLECSILAQNGEHTSGLCTLDPATSVG
jgi:hypothetical protein